MWARILKHEQQEGTGSLGRQLMAFRGSQRCKWVVQYLSAGTDAPEEAIAK